MKIESRPLDRITPYARNPRKNAAAIGVVKASLKEYGWQQPIVVDGDGVIIAGHTRYLAALELGWTEAPVHVAEGLTPAQIKAYRIMDNRSHEQAEWDMELLALEMEDLKGFDFDLELTGFSDEDLAGIEAAALTSETAGDDTEPQIDRAEELRAKFGVEYGQLWMLGEHRLLCGDSTKAEDVERLMAGEKANAVLTDPPYGQNQAGVPGDEPDNLDRVTDAVLYLPIENAAVVAFQSTRTFPAWLNKAEKAGLKFERMLWLSKKAQMAYPWRGWILKSEAILVHSKGNPNWNDIKPYVHDTYELPYVNNELPENVGWHGSVKPMSVVSDLLSRISAPGDILYEPFSGSGTTIIAAENLKRKCRAMEISPAYCAVALERWATHTGKQPQRHEAHD